MNLPRLLTALLAFGSTVVPAESIDFVQVKERLLRSRSLKTPDGDTPATETVCDGYEGQAYGICNAFCGAQDCIYGDITSCEKLREKWEDLTDGGRLPCAPTMSPTASPTMSPTKSPTTNPTESPIRQTRPGFYDCPAEVAFTSLANDNDANELFSREVNLPFAFNYLNAVTVNKVEVRPSGRIFVGSPGTIRVLFGDLTPRRRGGGIFTKENDEDGDGSADSVTISYEGLEYEDEDTGLRGGEVNAQAILHEDGRVTLCFKPGSIPSVATLRSSLFLANPGAPATFFYNPLDGFDSIGRWRGADGTHPSGCACFYPDTPRP